MTREIPSAQVWFAGGERGYDPNARVIVQTLEGARKVFVRREGDLAHAHAVSFLPGFPDGSFGWAKVLPHLPSGADIAAMMIPSSIGRSISPKNDWDNSVFRSNVCQEVTSPPMNSRTPLRP
jgi:hypothetical protein